MEATRALRMPAGKSDNPGKSGKQNLKGIKPMDPDPPAQSEGRKCNHNNEQDCILIERFASQCSGRLQQTRREAIYLRYRHLRWG
jgi:hypothetical protein